MSIRCTRKAAAVLLLAVIAFSQGGCQQNQAESQDDAEWLAGADRPPTARTLYAMATILIGQGKDAEAERVLVKIVQDSPTFTPAYVDLAGIYMRRRRVDMAARMLIAAMEMSPRNAILLNDLGMCHVVQRQYAEAFDLFQRASAAQPQRPKYRANVAMSLGMLGRYEEAFALYEQVVSKEEAHYNLGIICQARNDHVRAQREFALSREAANRSSGMQAIPPLRAN